MKIVMAPAKILSTATRAVTASDMEMVRDLASEMLQAMYEAHGIGLAAPQVGVDLRLAVVDVEMDGVSNPTVLINPEVVGVGDAWAAHEEGCLSLPGIRFEIARPATVKIRYRTLDGETREIDADGLFAVCLQHEIDHLDGVLFVDHLSPLKRGMVMRKFAKEAKRRMENPPNITGIMVQSSPKNMSSTESV